MCRLPFVDFRLHSLELLLDLANELSHITAGWGIGRIDRVSAHAMLGISTYPRDTIGSGTAHRFLRTLCSSPGAEVLRAEPAVIAGRAYGLTFHFVGLP